MDNARGSGVDGIGDNAKTSNRQLGCTKRECDWLWRDDRSEREIANDLRLSQYEHFEDQMVLNPGALGAATWASVFKSQTLEQINEDWGNIYSSIKWSELLAHKKD